MVVLYLLGILGFVMRRFDIPVAPAVVGMILGPIAEDHFRRALQIAQGNYATFITRPISAAILLLALLALVLPPLVRWGESRRGADVAAAKKPGFHAFCSGEAVAWSALPAFFGSARMIGPRE